MLLVRQFSSFSSENETVGDSLQCYMYCSLLCESSPDKHDVDGLSPPITDEKPPECDEDVSENNVMNNNENETKGSPSL